MAMIRWTFQFILEHPMAFFLPALAAAIGRFLQMGGWGNIRGLPYYALGTLVALARGLSLALAAGAGLLHQGLLVLSAPFSMYENEWQAGWQKAGQIFFGQWMEIPLALFIFGVVAGGLNLLIYKVGARPGLYVFLRRVRLLHEGADPFAVALFLKNLTVIPFCLVFAWAIVLFLLGKI